MRGGGEGRGGSGEGRGRRGRRVCIGRSEDGICYEYRWGVGCGRSGIVAEL